jgi:SNF2 family DNA or RNA helicase
LLTATPLQNSLLELYGLVSIIDEYAFGDLKSFKTQYTRITENTSFDDLKRRLEPICKRTLRRQVLEYINYTNRSCILQEFTPREDEKQLYDLVSDYLQRPNLYALPPGQRTLMTLILRKLLASSTYAISGTLQGLADKLEATIERQNGLPVNVDDIFATNYETFEEQQDEWIDDDEDSEGTNSKEERVYTADEIAEIQQEINALNEFKKLANPSRSIQKEKFYLLH